MLKGLFVFCLARLVAGSGGYFGPRFHLHVFARLLCVPSRLAGRWQRQAVQHSIRVLRHSLAPRTGGGHVHSMYSIVCAEKPGKECHKILSHQDGTLIRSCNANIHHTQWIR